MTTLRKTNPARSSKTHGRVARQQQQNAVAAAVESVESSAGGPSTYGRPAVQFDCSWAEMPITHQHAAPAMTIHTDGNLNS